MTILIAGGGIGGLSTAIALAHHGIHTQLLEQAKTFSEVGAGIQVGPNGMRILEHWGVTSLLEGKGATPEAVRLYDGLTGAQLNHVPLGEHARKRYGAPYRVFHRAELQMALVEKARSLSQITIVNGFQVQKFVEQEHGITVHSTSGDERSGRLMIGADGLWSRIRAQMYPYITTSFYGKSAWRAIIPRSTAPEPFSKMETGLWMAPDAHLVHYPIQGGEAINVVAVITEKFDKIGWGAAGLGDDLLAHYTAWDKTPRTLLNRVTGWQKWALFSLEHLSCWSAGRVTLLGDAAHPPIPFLAQGGVMAIEDAFVLAQELDRYGEDHESAFEQYESQRRARAYHVMDTADKLGNIYHMKGVMRFARNTILTRKKPEKLLADYDWLYGFEFETIS